MRTLKQLAYDVLNRPWPIGIRYNGHKLWGWKPIKIRHPHEPETVAFIKAYVKPGMFVADIGANVGFYTLLLSDLVGKDGTVIAYEPDPKNFTWLKKAVDYHARKRGWNNIQMRKSAVGEHEGTLMLYGRSGSGQNSIEYKVGPALYDVHVERLDSRVVFAKIDVEGHEVSVLKGMRRKTPCTVEYSKTIFKRTGQSGLKYIDDIRTLGYDISIIEKDGITHRLEGHIRDEAIGHVNLFLKPL